MFYGVQKILNLFIEKYRGDVKDKELVVSAVDGNKPALDKLILRHQAWIYNTAMQMVWHPQDAEDVT